MEYAGSYLLDVEGEVVVGVVVVEAVKENAQKY